MKTRPNTFLSLLWATIYLIAFILLPSCGSNFQTGPPVIASVGGSAFFLFPVQSSEGTKYFVGGSPDGAVAVRWKQADGSTVLMVKPERGNVEYYIDGKRVGAKEPDPVIPDEIKVPETPPTNQKEANIL